MNRTETSGNTSQGSSLKAGRGFRVAGRNSKLFMAPSLFQSLRRQNKRHVPLAALGELGTGKIKRIPGTPTQRDRLQTKGLFWTSGNKYVKEGFSEDPEE